MKRFIFATVLIAVIIGAMLYFVPQSTYNDVYNYADCNAVVNIYCRQTSAQSISTGLGYQVTCKVDDFGRTFASCSKVDGLSVRFEGNAEDVDAIINRLQATVVSCQQLGDMYVFCCESPRLQGGVTIDGNRVNVQIALNGGAVTVGYPLILGDY